MAKKETKEKGKASESRKSSGKEKKEKKITISGIRKESVARATIQQGTGIVKINEKPTWLFNQFQQLVLSEPLVIAEPILKEQLKALDINVIVRGGGVESQIEASRLAIARVLVTFTKSPELKSAFLRYDKTLLVADTRRKEMRKWGDSKARAKRQKSYR